MLKDREERRKQIVRMEDRLMEFEILRQQIVNSPCVKIPASVVEPTAPIKPNRALLIGLGLFASFGLGIGLVCLLEHVDHSVKVPEHVSHGLTLPLLGVVPRIRRSALTHRAGHLWTHATPDSIEADAYRNIRASLLGIADKRGPIVTLLVTSAKAGEGKSTTALNLAATCARAGERTLLLDVDLRRPSLGGVFIDDDPEAEIHGLVDVLRGELPWQRTVRHTELPNLDFIPTGDTRSIPIEILGTLELRQLLVALSHHYDRVILDGPAVLGLADCRVLGRIVDSSLLVVRSGCNAIDHPAPRQGDARAVARGDRRRGLQRTFGRHQQLVKLWIRAALVLGREARFAAERARSARARRRRIRRPAQSGIVRLEELTHREPASEDLAGDRPRADRSRGGIGLGQRTLFRRRRLVVSPSVRVACIPAVSDHARPALA